MVLTQDAVVMRGGWAVMRQRRCAASLSLGGGLRVREGWRVSKLCLTPWTLLLARCSSYSFPSLPRVIYR